MIFSSRERAVSLGLLAVTAGGSLVPGTLGELLAYPLLGVIPGMLLAVTLGRGLDTPGRWLVGGLLSPLIASIIGWVGVSLGLDVAGAARISAGACALAWGLLHLLPVAARPTSPVPTQRHAALWALLFAVAVCLPAVVNEFILTRSDSWIHAGIVREIQLHGIAVEDPRFAGVKLNYVWFYNLYIALLGSLRDGNIFHHMALMNTVNMAAGVLLSWRLGWAVWRTARAATGVMLLFTLGLNAGAWLLWPLRLIKALRGEVKGWGEVLRQVDQTRLMDLDVLYSLSAPFAYMVSFMDKFMLGTSLSYAWLMSMLVLWALFEWIRDTRLSWLVVATAGSAGIMFFHTVPGLAFIPVLGISLGVAWLLRTRAEWLPSRGRLAAFATALITGLLIATPYTLAVLSGWDEKAVGVRHQYLAPSLEMLWTVATSCGVAMWFARGSLLRSYTELAPIPAIVAIFTVFILGFALIVNLPEQNESKFAFQVFVPLALLGGAVFLDTLADWKARLGKATFVTVLTVLFAVPPVMTVWGFVLDPRGAVYAPLLVTDTERDMYDWMRSSTEPDAVVLDHRRRSLAMVYAQRRLYYGSTFGPEKAAFPRRLVERRSRVLDTIYTGPGSLGAAADSLRLMGRPVYVVYRPDDETDAARARLRAQASDFEHVWESDGFEVIGLRRAAEE